MNHSIIKLLFLFIIWNPVLQAQDFNIVIPMGHNQPIADLEFSPDGQYFISASWFGDMKKWDLRTGIELQTISCIGHPSQNIAFSPDGRYFASFCEEDKIKLWDANNSALIHTFSGHENVIEEVNFSPDSKSLISCGTDQLIIIWEVATGKKLKRFDTGQIITACSFLPDGKHFLTASPWNSTQIRELATGETTMIFEGHERYATKIHLIPDTNWLVTATDSDKINLWDYSTGDLINTFPGHTSTITDLSVDKNGHLLASSGEDNLVKIWEIPSGHLIREFQQEDHPHSVAISPDGRYCLSSVGYLGNYENFHIKLWEISSGLLLKTFRKRTRGVENVSFANLEPLVVLQPNSAFIGKTLRFNSIWDLSLGRMVEAFIDSPVTKNINWEGWWSNSHPKYDIQSELGKVIIKKADASILELPPVSDLRELAISLTEDWVALAIGDSIQLWDIPLKRIRSVLKGHNGPVNTVRFSSNGKYLLSGSDDNTAKLWDAYASEELATFILIDSTDWMTITPDKYYYASKGAVQKMGFSNGKEAYIFEQFDLVFNRPDLVLRKIGMASDTMITAFHNAYEKRLQKTDFKPVATISSFNVPQIACNVDQYARTVQDSIFNINCRISDSLVQLQNLMIYADDVPIYGRQGRKLKGLDLHEMNLSVSLPLAARENKIQVSVINQNGIESYKENFFVTYPKSDRQKDLYFIGIGMSEFADRKMNLVYPAKDVRDIAALLANSQRQNYQNIFIDTLFNKDFNVEQLLRIKKRLQHSRVDDHVVLYVAGHGLIDSKLDYFIATPQTNFSDPAKSSLSYTQLEDLLDSIPARQKLLLLDACHSGELDKENVELLKRRNTVNGKVAIRSSFEQSPVLIRTGLENSFELMKELFVELRRGTGTTIIASASGVEFAMEGDGWGNGVFAYSLKEGLQEKTADLDGNGQVLISELHEFLTTKVSELTDYQQSPTSRIENISNDWQIW